MLDVQLFFSSPGATFPSKANLSAEGGEVFTYDPRLLFVIGISLFIPHSGFLIRHFRVGWVAASDVLVRRQAMVLVL